MLSTHPLLWCVASSPVVFLVSLFLLYPSLSCRGVRCCCCCCVVIVVVVVVGGVVVGDVVVAAVVVVVVVFSFFPLVN